MQRHKGSGKGEGGRPGRSGGRKPATTQPKGKKQRPTIIGDLSRRDE